MSYPTVEMEEGSDSRQSEHLEQDTLLEKTKKDKARFEKVVAIHDKIQKIKAALHQLIQSMNNNHGWFSQAASFWYEIPLWKKILAGAAFTVPFLMIGIMTNLVSLITLSIVTGIIYTLSHILLENHQIHNNNKIENLNAGVSSLVDLLETVITTLDLLREQLSIEIDAFQKENALLTQHVVQLGGQVETLQSEIIELTNTEKALLATQLALEQTAKTLNSTIEKQSKALENTLKQLEETEQKYKENQNQLADKIKEFEDIKVSMGKEVEQVRQIELVLSGTVETFSNLLIQDKEQQTAFYNRLEDFLANKEKSFVEIADRICDAERKLASVTQELEESNQRYRKLLDWQEEQIVRLENIDIVQPERTRELFAGVKPSINGFYVAKTETSCRFDIPLMAGLM